MIDSAGVNFRSRLAACQGRSLDHGLVPQAVTAAQPNIAVHFQDVGQAVAHTRRFNLLDDFVVFVGLNDARLSRRSTVPCVFLFDYRSGTSVPSKGLSPSQGIRRETSVRCF